MKWFERSLAICLLSTAMNAAASGNVPELTYSQLKRDAALEIQEIFKDTACFRLFRVEVNTSCGDIRKDLVAFESDFTFLKRHGKGFSSENMEVAVECPLSIIASKDIPDLVNAAGITESLSEKTMIAVYYNKSTIGGRISIPAEIEVTPNLLSELASLLDPETAPAQIEEISPHKNQQTCSAANKPLLHPSKDVDPMFPDGIEGFFEIPPSDGGIALQKTPQDDSRCRIM